MAARATAARTRKRAARRSKQPPRRATGSSALSPTRARARVIARETRRRGSSAGGLRHRHFSGKLSLSSIRSMSAYRSSGVCSNRSRPARGRRLFRASGRWCPSRTATAARAAASPEERASPFSSAFPARTQRLTMSSSEIASAACDSESSPNDHKSSASVHLSTETSVTPGSRPNARSTAPNSRRTRLLLTARAFSYAPSLCGNAPRPALVAASALTSLRSKPV